jgi:hypothetical protein
MSIFTSPALIWASLSYNQAVPRFIWDDCLFRKVLTSLKSDFSWGAQSMTQSITPPPYPDFSTTWRWRRILCYLFILKKYPYPPLWSHFIFYFANCNSSPPDWGGCLSSSSSPYPNNLQYKCTYVQYAHVENTCIFSPKSFHRFLPSYNCRPRLLRFRFE